MNYLLTTYLILSIPVIVWLFRRGMKTQKTLDRLTEMHKELNITADNLVDRNQGLLKAVNQTYGIKVLDALLKDSRTKDGHVHFFKEKVGNQTNYYFGHKSMNKGEVKEYGHVVWFEGNHFPEDVGEMLAEWLPRAYAENSKYHMEEERRKAEEGKKVNSITLDEDEIKFKKPKLKKVEMEWERDEDADVVKATYTYNGHAYLSTIRLNIAETNNKSVLLTVVYFGNDHNEELALYRRYAHLQSAKKAAVREIIKHLKSFE